MRNNPNAGAESEYGNCFVEQARIEKIRRFFKDGKTKIYKHFCIQDYKSSFGKLHLKEYFEALDGFMAMGGKLLAGFDIDLHFAKYDDSDEISFDDLYDIL